MTKKLLLGLALMLILIIPTTSLNARAIPTPPEPVDGENFNILGSGSTFIFPLMDTWRVKYNALYPQISLNYQPIGSGAGISQFTKTTTDFGGTDAPLQPSQMKSAPGALTIPESIGPIAIIYNLNEFQHSGLKLTGPILADIYLGHITKWNDPQIQKINPGVWLPNMVITAIHRSDGSGTTFAFTDYLSKMSPEWKAQIGKSTSVPWRVGPGASGSGGVANTVKWSPTSLGYVDFAYAVQNGLTYAYLLNGDGTAFVAPSADSASAAAAGAKLPESDGDWSQVSIVNAPGKNSYPLTTFTYIVLYSHIDKIKTMSADKARALVHMIYWMVTDGQKYATKLVYAPLPASVQQLDIRGLAKVSYGGSQLFALTP